MRISSGAGYCSSHVTVCAYKPVKATWGFACAHIAVPGSLLTRHARRNYFIGVRIAVKGVNDCTGMVAERFNMTKLLRKRAHVIGSTLRSRPDAFKAELVAELRAQFREQLRHGDVKPVVDKVFPFDSVADAHRRMESSAHFGNIVLSWTL